MDVPSIAPVLTLVTRWASAREDVEAVALVGSHARGAARPDSDVDVMLLVSDPGRLRQGARWIDEIPWGRVNAQIASWTDEDYGAAWSRRIVLSNGFEIEMTFSSPRWAATDPCDEGTRQVIQGGRRILFDPGGMLGRLIRAIEQS